MQKILRIFYKITYIFIYAQKEYKCTHTHICKQCVTTVTELDWLLIHLFYYLVNLKLSLLVQAFNTVLILHEYGWRTTHGSCGSVGFAHDHDIYNLLPHKTSVWVQSGSCPDLHSLSLILAFLAEKKRGKHLYSRGCNWNKPFSCATKLNTLSSAIKKDTNKKEMSQMWC